MTALRHAWACITADCDAAGDGPHSDRDADRHTRTHSHATRAWATPQEGA